MKKIISSVLAGAALLSAAGPESQPPVAKVIPKEITMHGQTRVDNYFWLREKTNPEVIEYLEAENRYTESWMASVAGLREKLYSEILGRIRETDLSVPAKKGEYYYYTRTEKGKQYPIHCRKKGDLNAPEEVLLDQNELAKGQKHFQLANFEVSQNHKLLAYSTDTTGSESFTIYVKDLETGKVLSDQIPGTYYTLVWAADNKTLFYTVYDSAKRPYKLLRHILGTPAADDALIYHETDERFNISVGLTRSEEYILLSSGSLASDEVRYLPSREPLGQFKVIVPREKDIEYRADHHGDSFYIMINDTGRNFRLVKTPVKGTAKASWKEVIAHRPDVTLTGLNAFRNHLVVTERADALVRIRVTDLRDGKTHYIAQPEPVYTNQLSGNPEFDTSRLRFNYSSLVTPPTVFDYKMDTKQREVKKEYEVLGGYDKTLYESARVYATASDGTKIPMSLVYKKGFKRDGSAPLLLYGYGSYGAPMDPNFNSARLSLLDRGFVYAIAHIRGGGDIGKTWHDKGKLLRKKNTFTDFIACAEHLIKEKYTSSSKLVIKGGSAGGLLMGAVMNMRPDLFRIVIANVPFVDVLNTATDPTLPLTIGEYDEWGDSNKQDYFDYIKSYSPYDNVTAKTYPTMLVTAGLNDPRVSYWEPAKWVAKLRAMKKDKNPLLLKTVMEGGHFGPSGRYEQIKEMAFEYAFIFKVLGMKEAAGQ
jgi:oligopeptidase B